MSFLKYLPIHSLLFFISFTTLCQNKFEKATLIANFNTDNKYLKIIHRNAFDIAFKNYPKVHLYNWDEAEHSIYSLKQFDEIEKPIDQVKYIEVKLSNFEYPSFELNVDTSGKTISAQFVFNVSMSINSKIVEVKTSKILDLRVSSGITSFNSPDPVIKVPDFTKEFGGDPNQIRKTSSRLYEELVRKLEEKYKPDIEKKYISFCVGYASDVANRLTSFVANGDNRSFNVIRNKEDNDERKIKYVTFDGAKKDSLSKNNTLFLYEIINFENRISTKFVDGFYVDEVGPEKSTAKMSMWGNKKELANILRGTNELRFFYNGKAAYDFGKKNNKNTVVYNVAVKKTCLFCNYRLESTLVSIPILNTIERNAIELVEFQELAKLDKFIDYKSEELLNKQLGVKYLIYQAGENLMSTDIETGKILGSEGMNGNPTSTIVKNLFIENSTNKVEFLKNKEVTKNKVKEIILYSDFGFIRGEDLILFTEEDEKVGGKIIKRKVVIGEGRVAELISDFICVLRIKESEKQLFEQQNLKKEILLKYKIK